MNKNDKPAHAKLSPSASKRWMNCPGSVRLIETLQIKDKPTKYAAEGTIAHKICELSLRENKNPIDYLGTKHEADGFSFTVTKDMVEACNVYVDYIRQELEVDGTEIEIEVKCPLTSLEIPGLDGGTSDCVLINRSIKTISVIDYKHGSGVAVEADNNTQLMQYGLGAILKYLNEESEAQDYLVEMTVVQPRAIHKKGPIRTWSTSAISLVVWGEDILAERAKATLEPDAPLIPSEDACRFCPVNDCSARYNHISQIAMLDFDNIDSPLPPVETLTPEQKIKIMDHISMIRSFLIAVESSVRLEMDSGSTEYEGRYKLVESNTQRKMTEEAYDEIASPLLEYLDHDDLYEKKPKGIGALEESLKEVFRKNNVKGFGKKVKEILDAVTIKPKGEIVIAPESDSRPRISPSVVSDFDNLN